MAEIPPLDDERLDLLVAIYLNGADILRRRLSNLLTEDRGAQRLLLFQQVLEILSRLEKETDAWSATYVRQFVDEASAEAVSVLQAAGATSTTLFAPIDERAVRALADSLTGNLAKGRESIATLAQRIFRGLALEQEFPDLAQKAQAEVGVGLSALEEDFRIRSRIQGLLRERFEDGVVSVLAKNGRRMFFPLDFYAGMVAQNVKAQARSVATLERAKQAGFDLVRVTVNPSTVGDYCDAYRGRVYSISGSDPVFPPLAALPNGGPPFHPWCKHGIGIYVPAFHTPEENEERANTDPRFLMEPNEDSPNRVIRNYWEAERKGTLPDEIKFI